MKQIPVKGNIVGGNALGMAQFDSTDFVDVDAGGTGATTLQGARDNLVVPGKATPNTFSKGQRGAVVVLADAASIVPDFDAGNNFSLVLGGNRILANPVNVSVGQSGVFDILMDATGARTLAFGSYYKFVGGAVPTLSATPTTGRTVLGYQVLSLNAIAVFSQADIK
jgi:hypothetical protein